MVHIQQDDKSLIHPAHALDEPAAARLLFSQAEAGRHGDGMACSAVKPWPAAEGLSVVVVPNDDVSILVALIGAREGVGSGAPSAVTGRARGR